MHFLSKQESDRLEKKICNQIGNADAPKTVLYHGPSGSREQAARLVAAALGDFSEASLVYRFCITGDGYSEDQQDHPLWIVYRRWRQAQGEQERLYELPGHVFERGESALLAELLVSVLGLGWDAWLTVKPGRHIMFLSHDDRIDIYSSKKARTLGKDLEKIGWSVGS